MKHKIIALGALALIAGPVLAQGGRWVTVGSAPGGPIEVDRGSLDWHRMQHAVWRIRYNQPKPNGAVEERYVELIDCHERTSASLSTTALGPGGQVISVDRDPEDVVRQRLKQPTIGTPGRTAAAGACKLRPPPPKRTKYR